MIQLSKKISMPRLSPITSPSAAPISIEMAKPSKIRASVTPDHRIGGRIAVDRDHALQQEQRPGKKIGKKNSEITFQTTSPAASVSAPGTIRHKTAGKTQGPLPLAGSFPCTQLSTNRAYLSSAGTLLMMPVFWHTSRNFHSRVDGFAVSSRS